MSLFEENAEVPAEMAADGVELTSPRTIDFSHVFPDQNSANAFARDANREGFVTAVEKIEEREVPWDVIASKEMAPTCENITNTEALLAAIAKTHHGRSDGWGFFGV